MRILIVLVFILFAGSVFANSYGQSTLSTSDKSLRQVSLQLEVRNSAGQLITYLEPTDLYVSDIDGTHRYLDSIENKKIVTKNGETLELIEIQKSDTFSTIQQVYRYNLLYNQTEYYIKQVLYFRHDGYLSNLGDVLTAHFSIIRTTDRT